MSTKDSQRGRRLLVGFVLSMTVIGIWVAIAIPNSKEYVSKTRQSEAKVGLSDLAAAAIEMSKERKTFAVSDINQLGYKPVGSPRYSFWYAVDGIPTVILATSNAESSCEGPPTTVKVVASVTGFTAAARGSIGNKATCDEWSINETRKLQNTLVGLPRWIDIDLRLRGIGF